MFGKLAFGQRLLRGLHEKQAGLKLLLAAGATAAGAAHVAREGTQKAREYHLGFNPNYNPGERG